VETAILLFLVHNSIPTTTMLRTGYPETNSVLRGFSAGVLACHVISGQEFSCGPFSGRK
jgi:hypothetical protein